MKLVVLACGCHAANVDLAGDGGGDQGGAAFSAHAVNSLAQAARRDTWPDPGGIRGWLTTEQLVWDSSGKLTTHVPSTYKIPATGDVPEHFKVDLWHEANREDNVGGSKAVGEPPFMLAVSVWEAIREAVASARADGTPVQMEAPATAETVLRSLR